MSVLHSFHYMQIVPQYILVNVLNHILTQIGEKIEILNFHFVSTLTIQGC